MLARLNSVPDLHTADSQDGRYAGNYSELSEYEKGFVDAALFLQYGMDTEPSLVQFDEAMNQLRVHIVYGRPELPLLPDIYLDDFSQGFVEATLAVDRRVVQSPSAEEFEAAVSVLEYYLLAQRLDRDLPRTARAHSVVTRLRGTLTIPLI